MNDPLIPPHLTGPEQTYPGCDYSDEERHFITAMERYKQRHRRPFPTLREILHVVIALGYRKVADPQEPLAPIISSF